MASSQRSVAAAPRQDGTQDVALLVAPRDYPKLPLEAAASPLGMSIAPAPTGCAASPKPRALVSGPRSTSGAKREAGQHLSEPCAASGCNGVGNGDKFRVVSNEWIQPLPHQP